MAAALHVDQNLRTVLEAMTPQELDSLKQVGTYNHLMRALRATGWENLFWGALTLWLGTSALYPNIFTQIQTVVGAIIIAQSLWAIIRPSANGILALTCVLLFCGLWNLFITVRGGFAGLDLLLALLGTFQLWWAYRTYRSYNLLTQLPTLTPDPVLVRQYDTIWRGLAHPAPLLSPELMTMQLNRNRHWWNGIFLINYAIFAHKHQKLLLFASKPELIIVAQNPKAIKRKSFSVFTQFANQSWVGKVDQNGFQQYLQWKGIADAESEITHKILRMRCIRRIVWWIMVIILVVIFLYVGSLIVFVMKYV